LQSKNYPQQKGILISQGEASILIKDQPPLESQKVDVQKYLGWLNRELVFEDTPLQEVLDQVERWYNIRIITGQTVNTHEHVTVHLTQKPLEQILELLSALVDTRYHRMGPLVFLGFK